MPQPLDEARHMQRALRLAERGRGWTAPNPVVGAVVVRDGRVVGEGWHRRLGAAHAEAMALARAGVRARGATLYCTLEPCAHHGRTPPCTDAILAAGIRRCVIAVRDPHRIVDGRGLQRLRAGGVEVAVGLLADAVRDGIRGYLLAHTERRPRVTWKAAMTLDGRIADAGGRSRWITSPAARAAGHTLRARHDAILVGAATARADDPRLTVRRAAASPDPLRVVCDSRLRLPLGLRLFSRALAAGTVVACGPDAPQRRERELLARGVQVWRLPRVAGGVSPRALARRLVAAGCHEVLLEGGARLGAAWLRAGLVDEVAAFIAPRVLGEGLAWCAPMGRTLATAIAGQFTAPRRVGGDLFVRLTVGGR
jgi:diaminohydroxyphosphoribosylaminopyrimidine deaminase/5-amino-6-(5-phosphoribosylamino)uracil reductase